MAGRGCGAHERRVSCFEAARPTVVDWICGDLCRAAGPLFLAVGTPGSVAVTPGSVTVSRGSTGPRVGAAREALGERGVVEERRDQFVLCRRQVR